METINQETSQPTNKVAAGTAALSLWAIIVSIGSLALQNMAPTWYSPDLIIAVSTGMPIVINFIAGWFTKDKPNVVVQQ